MPQPNPIATWIAQAKICQYLWANDVAKDRVFITSTITPRYDRELYIVRKSIEWAYNNNPNDAILNGLAPFLYSLLGKFQAQSSTLYAGTGCIPPVIISNPLDQTIAGGGSVTFIVIATGTALTYQWQFNNVNIIGATSSTYSKASLINADAGNYRVIITNGCGSATSTQAVLTVGAGALIGYYYFGVTDYFTLLNAGTDNITYNGTFQIVNGQPLNVAFPIGASNNMFNVVKYPISQGIKVAYNNQTPNIGTIPDAVYRDIITIGNFYYIVSRVAMSLNSSFPMIYS